MDVLVLLTRAVARVVLLHLASTHPPSLAPARHYPTTRHLGVARHIRYHANVVMMRSTMMALHVTRVAIASMSLAYFFAAICGEVSVYCGDGRLCWRLNRWHLLTIAGGICVSNIIGASACSMLYDRASALY